MYSTNKKHETGQFCWYTDLTAGWSAEEVVVKSLGRKEICSLRQNMKTGSVPFPAVSYTTGIVDEVPEGRRAGSLIDH